MKELTPAYYQSTRGDLFLPDDFLGKKTLLFFYPRNFTPGCTRQSHAFSQLSGEYESNDWIIYGVNNSPKEELIRFKEAEGLHVDFISDESLILSNYFKIYGTHTIKGHTYTGLRRDVVLIDKNQLVLEHYQSVDADKSATTILSAIKNL
jgi:thioredoxin-dependent peroxiredoxin